MKLLLVEDEKYIAKPLIQALRKRSFVVEWEKKGLQALDRSLTENFDCIILDLNLPELDGLEIARQLREKEISTPILMLTARTGQENIYDGFNAGTDDYLTKPFEFKELVFRLDALIRRSSFNKSLILGTKEISLQQDTGKVVVRGNDVHLLPKEFGILEYLLRNKGKIVSQEELLEHVWDREANVFTQSVKTNIKTLRQKIDPDKKIIQTIRNKGYIINE